MEATRPFGKQSDFWWLFLSSLFFFGFVILAFVRDYDTDWLPIQKRFRLILEQHAQLTAAQDFRFGVKQLWLPALNKVDRCVTCHLGYEWGSVLPADLPQPFAPHPPLPYLDAHPFNRFGCTSCHGGQGYATDIKGAHGEVEHWEEPLLSTKRASAYGLTRRELMQLRCNGCHRQDQETPGMEMINTAKQQVEEKRCIACHVISGEGGLVGPELTYEGDKNSEFLDFTHVKGERTALNWHASHFSDPQEVVPGSAMPPFGFEEKEAKALALMLLSWKRESFPPELIPPARKPNLAGVPPVVREIAMPPKAAEETGPEEEGRRLFQLRGCHTCHSVGKGKLIGPDLQKVTLRHSDDWLSRWLADPAAMIRATPDLQAWPEQYGGIIMPNQNLTTANIQALLAYMKTF